MVPGRNSPCPCGSGKKFKRCCGSQTELPAPSVEDELLALRLLARHMEQHRPDHLATGKDLFWNPLEALVGADILDQTSDLFSVKAAAVCFIAIDLEPGGAGKSVAASVFEQQGADLPLGLRRALQAFAESRIALYQVVSVFPDGRLVLSPIAGGPSVEVTGGELHVWVPGDLAAARIAGPPGAARLVGDSHRYPAIYRDQVMQRTAQQKLDSRLAAQLWVESCLHAQLPGLVLGERGLESWLVLFAVHDPAAVEEAFANRIDVEPAGEDTWRWTELGEEDPRSVVVTLRKGALVGGAPNEATARHFREFVETVLDGAVSYERTRYRNLTQEAHENQPAGRPDPEATRRGLLGRRTRYPHLTADLHHYLDDEDLSIRIPREARAVGLYLGRIVAAVSAAPRGELFDIDVACRRRPGNRPCAPRLVARVEEDERIQWQCPACGDSATISGWEGTPFDQRDREAIAARGTGPDSTTRILVVSAADHRRLLGLVHLTAPALRLVMSARVTAQGERELLGSADELVALARCISFHFARSTRLSAAASSALSNLHHALALYGDGIPDTSRAAQCAEVLLFERSRRTGPRPARTPDAGTYRLDVRLQDIAPPIWRRLEVPGDFTLEDLYESLVLAFGWSDTHLHRFEQGGRDFGHPHPDDFRPLIDERSVRVRDVLARPGATMLWEYDFGDSWCHDIVVEEILDGPSGPPRLTAGARAAPPEDCGGPGGYEDLLEAVANPFHEQHEALREWSDDFDPEAFDLARFAERLARMAPARGAEERVEV